MAIGVIKLWYVEFTGRASMKSVVGGRRGVEAITGGNLFLWNGASLFLFCFSLTKIGPSAKIGFI